MKTNKEEKPESLLSESENAELALINRYTRKPLDKKDVYVFSVNLCDNDVDRDFECFSLSALNGLAVLFEGKTGIFDHNAKSTLQTSRIFKTWVETDKSRKTPFGEFYSVLKARAYMVRTKENESLIEEIEGGIKKEVSVSCSVAKALCSVCGADMRQHECEHTRGKTYSGSLCFAVLKEPYDAYEWSFVAVPAQRAAGVTKNFEKERETTDNIIEIIKSADSSLELSAFQVEKLKGYISSLEQSAQDAKLYRKSLLNEIERNVHIIMPNVDSKTFAKGCERMSVCELQAFSKGLKSQVGKLFPPEPQLKSVNTKNTADNTAYKI